MNELKFEEIPIRVIDETIKLDYASADELFGRFPNVGVEYLLLVGSFRSQSMLYKIRTPLLKVDNPAHIIFEEDPLALEKGFVHKYNGLELIAELAHPGEVAICHYADGSAGSYPEQHHESWDMVFNGYLVLLQPIKGTCWTYPRHMVFGRSNCQKQLRLWGIANLNDCLDGLQ